MLYPQLLDGDFPKLPRALREFHSTPGGGRASGTVSVRHVSRWLARLAGFPPSGDGIPLQVEVLAGEDEEVWTRRFGAAVLRTVQSRQGDLLMEAAGPVRVFFRVFANSSGMRFESQRARFWQIPLPLNVRAEARGNESSWEIQVAVKGIGSYRGMVAPTT